MAQPKAQQTCKRSKPAAPRTPRTRCGARFLALPRVHSPGRQGLRAQSLPVAPGWPGTARGTSV
eukprot:3980471-Alexandrium_andersonii.AAC.1